MNQKLQIEWNARKIVELHRRVHATLETRDRGPDELAAWKSACEEFRTRYEPLAFPGGTGDARERLRAGDQIAIEYALSFIETRPYFFRSGYMYKDFLRVLRNCHLDESQRVRYDHVRESYLAYRRQRNG